MAPPPESDTWEQIMSQLLQKTLHNILAARVPYLLPVATASASAEDCPSSPVPRPDQRFHLALGDLPDSIELHGGATYTLVVDIFLTQRSADADNWDSDPEAVVERWNARFVPTLPSSAASPHVGSFHHQTYKKFMILLRCIYALLRLLPVYRLFRLLCSSSQLCSHNLGYRVSSFAVPFSRAKETELKLYRFKPVETQFGRFVVTMQYRPNLSNFHFEVGTRVPPIIIPDYVGSAAAEPMRYFPASLLNRVFRSISFQQPPRGVHTLSTPSFGRPRSWNNARMMHHPFSLAPWPPVSQSESLLSEHNANPVPNQRPVSKSKGFKDNQDDCGRFSTLSSGGSPKPAVSRNLTQLSTSESDDENFPFTEDGVDTSDSDTWISDGKEAPYFVCKSPERASCKSPGAAIGVLVHMLQTAAPLRQCQSRSLQSSELNEEIGMSSSVTPRKIRDALEELQTYKEMNIVPS